MANEEELQQKYAQFQQIQQQMEEINQHLQMLTQQSADLDVSIEAIEGLGKSKTDSEILAPIANGIFIKGELKDNQKLLVNVGADTTVEKTIPEVVELLKKQKEMVARRITEMDNLLQALNDQFMKMYQELQ